MSFPSSGYLSALLACARGLAAVATGASLLSLGACSQTPVTVDLHSLQASGKVSFVCRADDGDPAGHKLDECPDYEHATRHLLGLVTQTATNEVAIVDLYAGRVVDVDPTTPGYSFLRVGASPGSIVTTPGGSASFVGVTGFQKNGIFALPSTCLSAPTAGQVSRDLTSWSACSLSSAPGEITVLVDPPGKSGAIRGACDGTAQAKPDQDGRECPADLTAEGGAPGRRKLLVSLPDEHKLVLLDAQSLLDRAPGEFTGCAVEATFGLGAAVPSTPIQPVLPPDLQVDPATPGADACVATEYPALTSSEQPTPDGFALSGQTLYVGDNTLPVVHVLDVSDPCAAAEEEPLLPHSYEAPNRVVTTSRVAVSPLTPSGKRYVYAVDRSDAPSSVMVFDVSPGSSTRTPLVFPNGPKQPYLPPDRLRFGPNVKDVSFVQRDFPAPDPATGVGQYGLACDPYPDSTSPATQYRPSVDYSAGARPLNLRGVFGFVLLSDGHIAVIDVEDFDASCRRPVGVNSSQFEDFRGCAPDKPAPGESTLPASFVNDGAPTVTNESTCNIIEPNRPRAASLSVSNSTVGLRAPTLRSFPQFENPDPASLLAGNERPRLLAVDFPNPDPKVETPIPAQVNISAQLYANCPATIGAAPCDGTAQALPVDPVTSTQNSLVLPLSEPRSYAADESPTLTYEGALFTPSRTSGFIQVTKGAPSAILHDPDANFCGSAGVEDSDSILTEAAALEIPESGGRRAAWAKAHADYVQITGDFPDSDDVYWADLAGATNSCTRDLCAAEFGVFDNQADLSVSRDLSILEASGAQLVVTPRCQKADGTPDPACDPALVLQDIHCCFPAGTAYTVRASHQWLLSGPSGTGSAPHDIAAGAGGRCVHTATCDPRKKFFHARAFEVCNSDKDADPDGTCRATDPTVSCVASAADIPVSPAGVARQCIFEDLTARFVVYRGARASTRGMSFSWQTTGGFTPLTMSLSTQSPLPTSLSYLPEVGYLAVIDSASVGLSLFDLNSLGVVSPSPFF
ncbi:MAG: hypothetical protein ABJB12_10255 [Pseudomonadota bacterium]